MKHTFYAQSYHWFRIIVPPLVAVLACLLAALYVFDGGTRLLFIAMAVGILAYFTFTEILPMLQTRLTIDETALSGRIGDDEFHVPWQDILVVRKVKDFDDSHRLLLATRNETVDFPLKYLDESGIWRIVEDNVEPAALLEDALKRLPQDRKWVDDNVKLVNSTFAPIRVTGQSHIKIISWLMTLLFALLFVWTLESGATWVAVALGLVTMLSAFLLISISGHIQISSQRINYITLLGEYEMRWNQVEWVEHDPQKLVIIFHGEDRRLPILGSALWSTDADLHGEDAYDLLIAHIQQWHVKKRERPILDCLRLPTGNTRLRWFA